MRWSCEWFGEARRTGRPVSSLTFGSRVRGTDRWQAGVSDLPGTIGGTIMHTHGGISRPFQTYVCAAHGGNKFSELARRCPQTRLTSEGAVVRSHLRPPVGLLTCANACVDRCVSAADGGWAATS